jgi:hypothetical protein
MKIVLVQYRVKPEHAGENERLVRNVFEQLGRDQPPGLHYGVFKRDDGVGFVHIAVSETTDNPLQRLSAFKEFTAEARARCAEQPVAVELQQIGSYRLFSD